MDRVSFEYVIKTLLICVTHFFPIVHNTSPALKVNSIALESAAIAAARWPFSSSGTPEMFAEAIKNIGSAGICLPCGRLG